MCLLSVLPVVVYLLVTKPGLEKQPVCIANKKERARLTIEICVSFPSQIPRTQLVLAPKPYFNPRISPYLH